VQLPAGAALMGEPVGDLGGFVRGEVVQDDVHRQVAGPGSVDPFEESQHVPRAVA
jgi:hypothetical protein